VSLRGGLSSRRSNLAEPPNNQFPQKIMCLPYQEIVIRHPSMSDTLVINPHPASLNFLSLSKILCSPVREAVSSGARATKQSRLTSKSHIRSSSSRGMNTPIVSARRAFYPTIAKHSEAHPADARGKQSSVTFKGPIRSSKNSAIFYSKLSKTLRSSGSQMPSVLLADAGCPSRRGAKRIPYSSTAGMVAKYSKSEPQLNGFCSTIDKAPKGAFDLDLFSQPRWSSGSKMPSVLLGTVRKEDSFLIRSACALP
jgi:hypothetical protein